MSVETLNILLKFQLLFQASGDADRLVFQPALQLHSPCRLTQLPFCVCEVLPPASHSVGREQEEVGVGK